MIRERGCWPHNNNRKRQARCVVTDDRVSIDTMHDWHTGRDYVCSPDFTLTRAFCTVDEFADGLGYRLCPGCDMYAPVGWFGADELDEECRVCRGEEVPERDD